MTTITGFKADQYGAYIEKDPQASLDYSIDWSDWLAQGDNLRTSSWTISTITGDTSPLVQVSNITNTQTATATIYVSGGSLNGTYTVTNHIVTDNGLVDERYFRIRVKNRSL